MIGWWQGLEIRQQRLFLGAALVLAAVLAYVWVWEPLVESRAIERGRVAQQQALADWLAALEPLVEQLRRDGGQAHGLADRSLLGLADETARAAGLAGALSRIEPTGENEVRLWLDDAEFVATLSWLENLSRGYPIRISQMQVDRARRPGRVNVRVTLAADA